MRPTSKRALISMMWHIMSGHYMWIRLRSHYFFLIYLLTVELITTNLTEDRIVR